MSHNLPALKALIVWLRQRHDVVMELETAAPSTMPRQA